MCKRWFGLICGILLSSQAWAAGPFGLGIILAAPTGLSANYYYERSKSYAMALAWDRSDVQIHVDHLWYKPNLIVIDRQAINVYAGIGLRLHDFDRRYKDNVTEIGFRVPVGVKHVFQKIPVHLFGELVPTLVVFEASELDIDIALGIRYYF